MVLGWLPSVASPGTRVTDSTQSGADCGFEFAVEVCRKSSQALSTLPPVPFAGVRGRPLTNTSCPRVDDTASRTRTEPIARESIWRADPNSMRANLQTLRHFKDRGENTEDHETDHYRNHYDDNGRNQRRDNLHGAIQLALVNIRDGLHRLGEMSGLLAHRHHVGEQLGK